MAMANKKSENLICVWILSNLQVLNFQRNPGDWAPKKNIQKNDNIPGRQ